ncbi:transposase [Mesorhizobium sp. M6A.T.Cr.TU.017.01.1.1]|uniref:Mu transposase C-terminal domain-containing protein n=1 Tax=Mesorhizobium sp. M6A.T.Cr.TU.017.01.1.1 TaxID=2496774 RepID=UPI000FD3FEF5|nr:Mu transposase C-terminal domain-containing protein [Mesorhizobium sp. M6A.T.Cr.TU.017.01.1.1]RUV04135.1 transposase [Mesorhizobium sp. M6A.T.Cr.TU.017.01.1.1]
MTTPDQIPRWSFEKTDRISIAGIPYRSANATSAGHVLQRVDQPDLYEEFSHAEVLAFHSSGKLNIDRNYFSESRTHARLSSKLDFLSDLSPKRKAKFLFKQNLVVSFMRGYADGRFRRTPQGYADAIEMIETELRNEQAESEVTIRRRETALRKQDRRVTAEIRKHGVRASFPRWDNPDRLVNPSGRLDPTPRFPTLGNGLAMPSPRALAGWVSKFEAAGCDPASLWDSYGNCGSVPKLSPQVLRLIDEAALAYPDERRPSMTAVYKLFKGLLAQTNAEIIKRGEEPLRCPSPKTFAKKVKQTPAFARTLARNGRVAASRQFAMASKGVRVLKPMERIEIDEWEIHLQALDWNSDLLAHLSDQDIREIKRVRIHVAVAMDVATRFVLGVSFAETASVPNVMAALKMAVSDRSKIASAAGAATRWGPFGGLLGGVHSDMGSSFGETFRVAVTDLQGDHVAGPAARSEIRGHIERLFRTLHETFLVNFTGRTFSNPVAKGDYDSAKRASLTINELYLNFVRHILDVYHNTPHGGLHGQTPYNAWIGAVEQFELPPPPDQRALRAIFGLEFDRVTTPEGIHFQNLKYNSEKFQKHRQLHGDGRVRIRVDCDNIHEISVLLGGEWHPLRTHHSLEGISIAAWAAVRNELARRFGEEARIAEPIVLQAISDIKAAGDAAAVRARLGATHPSAQDIERDQRKLFIGFDMGAPQVEAPSLAQDSFDVLIPFSGEVPKPPSAMQSERADRTAGQQPVVDPSRNSPIKDRGHVGPAPTIADEAAVWLIEEEP